jgi:hypothetical protein
MAPKIEGVKKTKKKPLNDTKANSQTPKKILVRCFITIKVEKGFVKLQVPLL